ncbi:MAG TPA: hypothetical protein VFF16_18540 [Telluria sp.]|nr:hypothetical protein [Telluria sp.]
MEEIQVIGAQAQATRELFRAQAPAFSYNAHSIKLLSDAINARRGMADSDRGQLVQRFGAFLGSAMIAAHPDLRGRWVRVGTDLGIAFQSGSECRLAFPMQQVERQLDEGANACIVGLFLGTRDLVLTPSSALRY